MIAPPPRAARGMPWGGSVRVRTHPPPGTPHTGILSVSRGVLGLGAGLPDLPPTHNPRGRSKRDRVKDARRAHDAKRALVPWRKWYQTPEWKTLRAYVLRRDPSCRLCLYERKRIVIATTVDHVKEHKGDWELFISPSNCWGLCGTCHNSTKKKLEYLAVHGSEAKVKEVYQYLSKVYAATVVNEG